MHYSNAFVLSLLSLTVAASGDNNRKMSEYLGYVGQYEKDYKDSGEFLGRLKQFMDNDDYINECNYNAGHSDEHDPVFCGHNQFSDWTEEEYRNMLGFVGNVDEVEDSDSQDDSQSSGGLQIAEATTVDHTQYMTEVKNQGGCGSCWAFAATSALEGSIGVHNKKVADRFSEQQQVDCTRDTQENEDRFGKNYGMGGCRGGWMSPVWAFMKDHGAMTNEDYPYKAKHQTCAHDDTKIIGRTKDWGVTDRRDVQKMKDRIKLQPAAIAMSATRQFRFYKSGTMKKCCDPNDSSCKEDTVPINHGVIIVGYSEGSPDKKVRKCNVNDWWVGCEEETEEGTGEADAQGDKNYWKIQNSWGKNWGDNGFVKFEIQDGRGVCGMNAYGAWWANWDHQS